MIDEFIGSRVFDFITGLMLVVLLCGFLFLVISFPFMIYEQYSDNKTCVTQRRTLVNHPAHLVGKVWIPESVSEDWVCVERRK